MARIFSGKAPDNAHPPRSLQPAAGSGIQRSRRRRNEPLPDIASRCSSPRPIDEQCSLTELRVNLKQSAHVVAALAGLTRQAGRRQLSPRANYLRARCQAGPAQGTVTSSSRDHHGLFHQGEHLDAPGDDAAA
ncbi:hypothetical protein V5799_006317 [Amblyomma americanum]|uniref:Uncharacterized protein n=1 Tax=Amblyomma americanum TaxID=6943 RepID=A0AAQ4DWQ6_AMBAM